MTEQGNFKVIDILCKNEQRFLHRQIFLWKIKRFISKDYL